MGYSEKEFWQLTPRYLWSQVAMHYYYESAKWGGGSKDSKKKQNQPKASYIDQIPGWG